MKNVSSRLEECVQRNGDHLEGITFRTLDLKSSMGNKLKSSPTGHVGPEGSRRVKAPSFRDNGTTGGRLSAIRTGCLYPQEQS